MVRQGKKTTTDERYRQSLTNIIGPQLGLNLGADGNASSVPVAGLEIVIVQRIYPTLMTADVLFRDSVTDTSSGVVQNVMILSAMLGDESKLLWLPDGSNGFDPDKKVQYREPDQKNLTGIVVNIKGNAQNGQALIGYIRMGDEPEVVDTNNAILQAGTPIMNLLNQEVFDYHVGSTEVTFDEDTVNITTPSFLVNGQDLTEGAPGPQGPQGPGPTQDQVNNAITQAEVDSSVSTWISNNAAAFQSQLSLSITPAEVSTALTSWIASNGTTFQADVTAGVTQTMINNAVTQAMVNTAVTQTMVNNAITAGEVATALATWITNNGSAFQTDVTAGISQTMVNNAITAPEVATALATWITNNSATFQTDINNSVTAGGLATAVSTWITNNTALFQSYIVAGITSAQVNTALTTWITNNGVAFQTDITNAITAGQMATAVTTWITNNTATFQADVAAGVTQAMVTAGITQSEVSTGVTAYANANPGVFKGDISLYKFASASVNLFTFDSTHGLASGMNTNQAYKIRGFFKCSAVSAIPTLYVRFNGDNGSNYTYECISTNGATSTVTTSTASPSIIMTGSGFTNAYMVVFYQIEIMQISGDWAFVKCSATARQTSATIWKFESSGTWMSSAAITQIQVVLSNVTTASNSGAELSTSGSLTY